jgi:putative hydrolase of the HAD superfamily
MTTPLAKWVIFDGDNTLWDVESLYNAARVALCELVAGEMVSRSVVDTYQRAYDKKLHAELGYSPKRFPRSFADTAAHFLGNGDPRVEAARSLGEAVFAATAAVPDDLETCLIELAKTHRLALLTAGDLEVQARRLQHFGHQSHFHEVKIVERKDIAMLTQFLVEIAADPAQTWMVGDSVRSDIIPAIAVGLKAIHLEVDNWYEVEVAGNQLPAEAHVARSLTEATAIILGRGPQAIGP